MPPGLLAGLACRARGSRTTGWRRPHLVGVGEVYFGAGGPQSYTWPQGKRSFDGILPATPTRISTLIPILTATFVNVCTNTQIPTSLALIQQLGLPRGTHTIMLDVDWLGLAVPFAYLTVLGGSLATFSNVYRKRKAGQYCVTP